MEAEWRHAAAFAEVAEALELPTDRILGARRHQGTWTVLYTDQELEGEAVRDTPVHAAILKRDEENILRVVASQKAVTTVGAMLPPSPEG